MFNVPEMDVNKVIEDLKPRSGKTLKFTVKHVFPIDNNMHVLLLSNATEKICVVLKAEDMEKLNVTSDNIYLVKNLEHIATKNGIPVFKITAQTTFKKSGLKIEDSQDFTEEEVKYLKSLDVGPFLLQTVQKARSNQDVTQKKILSLLQFTQMNPRSVSEQQVVDVSKALPST